MIVIYTNIYAVVVRHRPNTIVLQCIQLLYKTLNGFRYTTQAKMVDTGTGTLYIIGSFKRQTVDPDFKVMHAHCSLSLVSVGATHEILLLYAHIYGRIKKSNVIIFIDIEIGHIRLYR